MSGHVKAVVSVGVDTHSRLEYIMYLVFSKM